MGTTLTLRTDEELRAALRRKAELQGKTVSELAREILTEALAERPLSERVGHLRGRLPSHPSSSAREGKKLREPRRKGPEPAASGGASDAWRDQLRRRNWRL
jgi:hypothetical protein